MSILNAIFRDKRDEVARRMERRPLGAVRQAAEQAAAVTSLLDAVRRHRGPAPAVIAEIKRRSPSKGALNENLDPAGLARVYADAGAAGISVLTDRKYFGGSLADLREAASALRSFGTDIPLLRKDFVFSPYQVYEARAAGAGAVLLIAAMLEAETLKSLVECCRSAGLTALVEVHDRGEVDQALAAGAELVGINNRDLHTFEVDLGTTIALRKAIPEEIPVVAESGIRTVSDVRTLAEAGAQAILVGEAFVTTGDPGALLAGFTEAAA